MLGTLVLALVFAFYPIFGSGLFLFVGLAYVAYAGVSSNRIGQPQPFWMSIASFAIFAYLLPPLGYRPTETDAVINSILFTSGGYLAYSGIQSGHWSARLLAFFAMVPYIYVFFFFLYQSYTNWQNVIEYWWP